MEMHLKRELIINSNNIIVDFVILQKVKELMEELGINILKLVNNTKWDILLFEQFMKRNLDTARLKKIELIIKGVTDNKLGKTIDIPSKEDEKPMCDITDSGIALSGFTIHYLVFNRT